MENEVAKKFVEAWMVDTQDTGFVPKDHLWDLIFECENSQFPAIRQSAAVVKRMAEQFDEVLVLAEPDYSTLRGDPLTE